MRGKGKPTKKLVEKSNKKVVSPGFLKFAHNEMHTFSIRGILKTSTEVQLMRYAYMRPGHTQMPSSHFEIYIHLYVRWRNGYMWLKKT